MALETILLVKVLFNKDRTSLDADNFNKVHRFVGGSIEKVEEKFGVEFSCGDGKYPSQVPDSELPQYDGKVSLVFPPRLGGKQKPLPEELVFRVQEHPKTGETRCQVGVQTRTHVKWLS
jgi:hypothetical protein